MITAGIDEAGLGPNLGPLTVSLTAFELPDNTDQSISLWDILKESTTGKNKKNDNRLLITDSKISYKAAGIAGLKKSVYSFFNEISPDEELDNLTDLLQRIIPKEDYLSLSTKAWYKELLQDKELTDSQDKPATYFTTPKLRPLELRSRFITATAFNAYFAKGYNKSEAVLQLTGSHIQYLLEKYPQEEIYLAIDKQGGKNFYAPYLTDLLGGAWVTTIKEGAALSSYKINDNVTIEFFPKADQKKFTVALASITAKYLRETAMESFNNYFIKRLPELKPTAGYPKDAPRFLSDIAETLKTEKIAKSAIWRER